MVFFSLSQVHRVLITEQCLLSYLCRLRTGPISLKGSEAETRASTSSPQVFEHFVYKFRVSGHIVPSFPLTKAFTMPLPNCLLNTHCVWAFVFRVTRESAIFKEVQSAKPEEATVTALNPVLGLYSIPAIQITKSISFCMGKLATALTSRAPEGMQCAFYVF